MPSHKIIIIEGLLSPLLYLIEKGRCTLLDEKALGKLIPQFSSLTIQAKQRQLSRWLNKEATVVRCIKPRKYLPNAHKAKTGEALRSGALAFLSGADVFEAPIAGYTILAHILCGLHISALQKIEPGFRLTLSINSKSPQIKELLISIISAVVPRRRWTGKHYEIKREAILNYEKGETCGLSAHIQDFSRIKVRYKKYKIKAPFFYRDTVALVIGADSAQIKEAAPYLEPSSVILLNSVASDLIPTKLPPSSMSAYDTKIAGSFQSEAPHIAALLRWWWGEALENKDAWSRDIIQKAHASFGKPDSRYVRVELDPKQLREATCYQVLLSFLDALETAGLMTGNELALYRQGAKDIFDPAPPESAVVHHAEDPDVFLKIMREILQNSAERIVSESDRYLKKEKPLAAWRTIGGERYLVFLEDVWARAYAKAVRTRKNVETSFFSREHWERDIQKILSGHGLIKEASSGSRYRYDLLQNGTRDSTYVVAIPAQLLEG